MEEGPPWSIQAGVIGILGRFRCEFTQKPHLCFGRRSNEASSSLPPSARKERENVCNCESLYRFHCRSTLGSPEAEPGAGRGLEGRSVFPRGNQSRRQFSLWLGYCGEERVASARMFLGGCPRGGDNLPQAPRQQGQRGCDAAWQTCIPRAPLGPWILLWKAPLWGASLHVAGDQGTESRRTGSKAQLRCRQAADLAARRPTATRTARRPARPDRSAREDTIPPAAPLLPGAKARPSGRGPEATDQSVSRGLVT